MFSYVGCWHFVKVVYKKDMVIKNICLGHHLWQWFIFCLLANSLENLLKKMDVYFILIVKS
jgi:hypothetical protein